jgi:hypothetical protein
VKLYRILADSEVSRSLLARIASDDLKVPEYIRDSDSLIEEMLALPKVLYDYLDHREFSYKTIRMVAAFPVEIRDLLSRWLAETSLRKNIFKEVVEYVLDIYKRDLAINALIGIDLTSVDDNRKREDTLCGKLFELRYPEYSRRKMIFDEYKRRIEKKGFMVKYPEYFEGDNIVIGLKIEKTETPEFISRRLSEFNYEELYKLLQAL